MRVGLQLPFLTWPEGPEGLGSTLAAIARTADEAGFYSLWLMDHFFQIPLAGPAGMDMLECYSALSFCAAHTKRVKLGAMTTGVIYRNPGVLVKTATTLDVLSGGRSYFSIGAAWFEREARGLGVGFPPISERFEMLEETLRIAKQMWSGDAGPFEGKHYQLAETLCRPLPLSKPHPPILVAGAGEKKTLRLVAQYADACNIIGDAQVIGPKLEVLRRHCDDVGRDFDDIEITSLSTFLAQGSRSPAETVAHCKDLAAAGVRQVIFVTADANELTPLRDLGREVIPAVASL